MAIESDLGVSVTLGRIFGEQESPALPANAVARRVVRLVDCVRALDDDPTRFRELLWQVDRVEQALGELPSGESEAEHLRSIVDAIPLDGTPIGVVGGPLAAYARYLEYNARFEDALVVLKRAAYADDAAGTETGLARWALEAGRLNRLLARFDSAAACYSMAATVGAAHEDYVASLRGRLGCAAVLKARGNLREAEVIARGVVRAAERLSIRQVQYFAVMDLSAVLGDSGRRIAALGLAKDAVRLAVTDDELTRAWGDLGVSLVDVGAYDDARPFLEDALASAPFATTRVNARLELMRIDASLGNRVGFERHREALENMRGTMTPSVVVDYCYKLGEGYRRLGRPRLARSFLEHAIAIAETHGLTVWCARIRRSLPVG